MMDLYNMRFDNHNISLCTVAFSVKSCNTLISHWFEHVKKYYHLLSSEHTDA